MKHTAKVLNTWFENKKVNVMKCPAQSPDLSPIENLLGELKCTLIYQGHKLDSMGWQCNAVIKNKNNKTLNICKIYFLFSLI